MTSRLPVALALLGILLSTPAAAKDWFRENWFHELRGGVLWHDVDDLWSSTRKESGVDWSAELLFWRSGIELPLGALHPNLGVSINGSGHTSKAYAGLLWEFVTPFGVFLDLGLGAAIHDGRRESRDEDRKELGTRVLARTAVEIGYALTAHHRLMVSFDHISNASIRSPNDGLDTLGIRYGYRF